MEKPKVASEASAVLDKEKEEMAQGANLNSNPAQEFEFGGRHLIASYIECQPEKLLSYRDLDRALRRAIEASGATVLKDSRHIFENGGMTIMYLLSESHATIHTYPEHNSCFVDIFTCGYVCDPMKFHESMIQYLNPKTASRKLTNRGVLNVDITIE